MTRFKTQLIPLATIMAFLVASFYLGYTPRLVGYTYILVSLLTITIYAIDKSAAISHKRRISENTLHLLSLFCGWPGAIIAQEWLRHKTWKKNFRRFFWGTVVLNCVALFWLHTEKGSFFLHRCVSFVEQLR